MTNYEVLSNIVVYSKYARFLPEQNRRETWHEIVTRNMNMHIKKYPEIKELIKENYKYVYDKQVLPSMRSLQFGGKAIEVNNARMFNCSFVHIDNIRAFSEIMFLSLSGCGVGMSVQEHHVGKLPPIQKPTMRKRKYLIPDSIEGWAEAIKVLLKSYFGESTSTIDFDYSEIREKGAAIITSSGKAPGPTPLRIAIEQIRGILNDQEDNVQIRPFIAHRIACLLTDAVLAGGVRRSSLISLFSKTDNEMMTCKTGSWWELYPELGRANNSVILERSKTSHDEFKRIYDVMKTSGAGEPGFMFTDDIEFGFNPCAEIQLRSKGVCNLVEINGSAITDQLTFNKLASVGAFIATLQAGYTNFHYLREEWKQTIEEDALIGVSITGIANDNLLKLDETVAVSEAVATNAAIADMIGINKAKRIAAVKPAGTTSIVLQTSSGIHAWHDEYFVRRMRIGKNETIHDYLQKLMPELIEDEFFRPKDQSVLSIPIKAPDGAITRHESTLDLLERIKRFNINWVHNGTVSGTEFNNVSATVSVKDEEWDIVRDWMWVNKDSYAGISLLPFDETTYQQMPFESITKEEYERLSEFVKNIDLTKVKEYDDKTDFGAEAACSGGNSCEVDVTKDELIKIDTISYEK